MTLDEGGLSFRLGLGQQNPECQNDERSDLVLRVSPQKPVHLPAATPYFLSARPRVHSTSAIAATITRLTSVA